MDKRIEVFGTTRQDLNGKRGVATDFHICSDDPLNGKDRYAVRLDSGESFSVKVANLRLEGLRGVFPLIDMRVESFGLAGSEGIYNGKTGVAVNALTDEDKSSCYLVDLDNGEKIAFPVAHVRAERVGASGSPPKAKGKGKKGRG